jgi:hypothetical protein
MTPSDYYNGAIEAGRPEYIAFRNLCHKHHIQIKGDDELETYKGVFTSIRDGIRTNIDVLDRIFTLINTLGWNGDASLSLSPSKAAYSSKIIRSLKALYSHYIGNEDAMEKALIDNCFGMEYYKDNIYNRTQYEIFDFLMVEIEKGVKKNNIKVIKTA